MEDLLPPWATGLTNNFLEVGAQLCTKDGRKIGNAVVTEIDFSKYLDQTVATIITNAGTTILLNEAELRELFHQPQWKMDPATAPGLRSPKINEP